MDAKLQQVMELIIQRMFITRPRAEVKCKPYLQTKFYRQEPVSSAVVLDFDAAYPGEPVGTSAYASSYLRSNKDTDAVINLFGCAKIWLNEEVVFDNTVHPDGEEKWTIIPIHLMQGKNKLLMQCNKEQRKWEVKFIVACARYPWIWSRDYLFNVRAILPFDETEDMEGVACALKDFVPPQLDCRGEEISFRELWDAEQGTAYALTYLDTEKDRLYYLKITGKGIFRAWIGGKERACSNPVFIPIEGDGERKEILIRCEEAQEGWSFLGTIYEENAKEDALQQVPFVTIGKGSFADWLYLGPFVEGKQTYPPEKKIQFHRPYPLGDYGKGFWQLGRKNVIIRPYLDEIFFGQWFYAIQVGMMGILSAANVLRNQEYVDYFLDSVLCMADYFDYTNWEYEKGMDPTMIPRASRLTELDPCGTIGVSMIEAYLRSGNERLLPVIQRIADVVMNDILRFEDDTYYRGKTMWADDFYMSCPFLARMARLSGQKKYADRVYAQVEGFHKRLWMEENKLFSHIYFPKEETPNKVLWGRGNGWVAVALTEILLLLEKDERWEKTLRIFQEFAEGIRSVQDASGMWHQVLNRSDTYEETSATAMFLLSFQRGIEQGWLDESFEEVVERGWKALLNHSIDEEGNILGVCMGSGCSMDADYYANIPTHCNDDHGTGIILMAAAERLRSGKGL